MDNINDHEIKMREKDIAIAEIIKTMMKNDITVAEISEELKRQICDHCCKYPEQYEAKGDDIDFDRMLQEHCNNCIFNII